MLVSTKARARRKTQFVNANTSAPEYLTTEFVQRIRSLPDYPETTYLKDQFLTKFVSSETDSSDVRRQRAIEKWLATEVRNAETNDRLFSTHEEFNILPRVSWKLFLGKLRSIVCDMIGETIPEEALIGSFSGGSSTSRSRRTSLPAGKYLGQADITSAARPWFDSIIESCPGWTSLEVPLSIREVPGNILFTVPKNTTIDRCACMEPDLNMFLQKGVGNFLRRSLRNVGINLNDQTRNQRLAREGSLTGDLATLDLSSASDSITSAFVELALPDLWYSLLNGLRCPITIIDGEEHVNEMFSSMGNGFTFELQSMLFFSVARTVSYFRGIRGVVSVYGDDIICHRELAQDLIWVLNYLGFIVNDDKSFVDGPFRESCGGHYYDGYDITPFYLRKPIGTLTDIIHAANAVRKWCDRSTMGILSPLLEDTWMWLKSHVPESLWGGHEYGSITQLVSPDQPRKRLVSTTRFPKLHRTPQFTDGSYIHWLNTTWARDHQNEAIVTSDLSIIGNFYRLRPARESRDCSISLYISEL